MDKTKVITWREADIVLCKIAAEALAEILLYVKDQRSYYQTFDFNSWLNTQLARNTYFIAGDGERVELGDWGVFTDSDIISKNKNPDFPKYSTPCWWALKNILQISLKHARKQLHKDLYGANPRKNIEKNSSRKPSKKYP